MAGTQNHSTRVAIISAAVSFFLSCVFAAYVVGQRTGVVIKLQEWQREAAPRMERMDSSGTLSQQFFLKSYQEEQAKQYKRLEKLEDEASHLEAMELRIERLEREAGIDGNGRKKQ